MSDSRPRVRRKGQELLGEEEGGGRREEGGGRRRKEEESLKPGMIRREGGRRLASLDRAGSGRIGVDGCV